VSGAGLAATFEPLRPFFMAATAGADVWRALEAFVASFSN
jgi:hypothetical protein